MAYMELHQEFRDHTKMKRLASFLNISRAEARSMIISLWLWAIAEARSGDLSKYTSAEIADACHMDEVRTKIDPPTLLKALSDAHIIDSDGSKNVLHDWKKHGVRILEDSKRRTRKYRKNKENEERTVTSQQHNGGVLLSFFLSINHSLFPSLQSPEFAEAWGQWVNYRIERRRPITQSTANHQLKFLAIQPNPIQCILQSVRNGWQGLFEVKENGKTIGAGNRQGNRERETFTRETVDRVLSLNPVATGQGTSEGDHGDNSTSRNGEATHPAPDRPGTKRPHAAPG